MPTTPAPRSKFGWCGDGNHADCRRAVPGSGVHTGTIRHCGCLKPGCPCADYVEEVPGA